MTETLTRRIGPRTCLPRRLAPSQFRSMIGLKKWSVRPRRVKQEFLPKQNRVLLLSNRVPQIGTSQSTFNRQNNVLQLSIKKERAFEVREEDRECQGWRVGGDIDPSALDISAGLGDYLVLHNIVTFPDSCGRVGTWEIQRECDEIFRHWSSGACGRRSC